MSCQPLLGVREAMVELPRKMLAKRRGANTALETAIGNDNADVAELEGILVQRRQSLQLLSVEVEALKRAAALRPMAPVADGAAHAAVSTPELKSGRFKNVVAQIRTSDPAWRRCPKANNKVMIWLITPI